MGQNHDEFFQPEEEDGGTLGIIRRIRRATPMSTTAAPMHVHFRAEDIRQ
jgi:hypothetical protein